MFVDNEDSPPLSLDQRFYNWMRHAELTTMRLGAHSQKSSLRARVKAIVTSVLAVPLAIGVCGLMDGVRVITLPILALATSRTGARKVYLNHFAFSLLHTAYLATLCVLTLYLPLNVGLAVWGTYTSLICVAGLRSRVCHI